jgi:DNA-directed RNA polymerase subunit M/transcription elongation factor TFIIS
MLSVSCPQCSNKMQATEELAGKTAKCGECGHYFVIGAPDESIQEVYFKEIQDEEDDATEQAPATLKRSGWDSRDARPKSPKNRAMLSISCPQCSSKMKAPDELAGKKAKCGKCGFTFVIEAAPRRESEPEHAQPPPIPSLIERTTNQTFIPRHPKRDLFSALTSNPLLTITAVATCVMALCVVAVCITYFSDRGAKANAQSREEKLHKFRELTKRCLDAQQIKDKILVDVATSEPPPATVREANERAYKRLKELGMEWDTADKLWFQRRRLGEELGISEDELTHPERVLP